jgi:hypothetical protein
LITEQDLQILYDNFKQKTGKPPHMFLHHPDVKFQTREKYRSERFAPSHNFKRVMITSHAELKPGTLTAMSRKEYIDNFSE